MASGDVSFPKIADNSWWMLRDLFKKKVPAIVTPTYLATALKMGEASAKSNLISPFKKIGIIDEDNKPTDLAYDWRDEHKYLTVCKKLIEDYYPQELRDLFHSPDADLQQLTTWFMRHAKCGEPAARMFARFYLLLLKADPSEGEAAASKKTQNNKAPKSSAKIKSTKTVKHSDKPYQSGSDLQDATKTNVLNKTPELHINIQLHISPESSAEQIDKIFESMAKHLKDFNK